MRAVNDNLAAPLLPFERREEQGIYARSFGFNRATLVRGGEAGRIGKTIGKAIFGERAS